MTRSEPRKHGLSPLVVLIFGRSITISKDLWRRPGIRRTLDTITLEPLVETALRDPAPTISCTLSPGGSEITSRSFGPPRALELHFADGQAKLRLREQAYTPNRPAQHLATLALWEPVRVVLNGRSADYSGQRYHLEDYHVVLCDPAEREPLEPTRTIDLQADLL